ncbi:MAG TPA: hypothetical protein EYM43_08555 [Alphaproteobacteria bacterium]|nr:hypothetical protein [Alphaproteobacteria bacterium]
MPENNRTPSSFVLTLPTLPTVLITTGMVFLGFAFLFYETFNMMKPILPGYPGDAFFPRLAVGYTLIIAALILLRGILLPRFAVAPGEPSHVSVHWLEFLSVAALVLVYAQLLPPVGFELTTLGFMLILLVPRFAVQHGLVQSVVKAVALTIPTIIILYGVFALLLGIHLPLLFLPRYIQ